MCQMMIDDVAEDLITAAQAARRARVHRSTNTRWVHAGLLIPRRPPGSAGGEGYLFAPLDVDRARGTVDSRRAELERARAELRRARAEAIHARRRKGARGEQPGR